MARLLGDDVDQPEIDLLRVLLAEGPTGTDRWAGLEAGVFCGRQNIKTWGLKRSVMYDGWVRDVKRITWSAQLYKTTQEVFNDIAAEATNIDWLRKRVKKIRFANGEEGIELTNGATIDFVARSAKAARGLAADTVVLDEALYVTPAMMGALLPTLSTRPKPHVRYGSSPGILESDVARSVRNRGRAGGDPTLAYIEWTSEQEQCASPDCGHDLSAQGCQLDDEAKWFQANPALGRRIALEYVRQERRALPPEEFARERLGWWEDPPDEGVGTVFPMDAWRACRDERATIPEGPVVLCVDVSWDRSTASVVAVGGRELPVGQLVHTCDPSEVVAWLATTAERREVTGIAVQATGAPASSLVPDLERDVHCRIVAMNGGDVARACGMAYDAVASTSVRHTGQLPIERALGAALSRPMSDGWALDRKKSRLDISPLVAWVGALWLHLTTDDGDPGVWFL